MRLFTAGGFGYKKYNKTYYGYHEQYAYQYTCLKNTAYYLATAE